jgi:hypothetical protein
MDFEYFIQQCFICRPSSVPEDAGIESRTVSSLALTDALTPRQILASGECIPWSTSRRKEMRET